VSEQTSLGALSTHIAAMAYTIPERVVTNRELAERFGERPIRSIERMAGIVERRVVGEGQTASDLGLAAARAVIEAKSVDPGSIDLLLFVSQTPDYKIPPTACWMQGELGLPQDCTALDVNHACASFLHALQLAHGMLVSGQRSRALIVNADALTTLIHPQDRGLVPLHGDGACATLLEPCPADDGGIEGIRVWCDGPRYQSLIVPAGGARQPISPETGRETVDEAGCVHTPEHLWMDGARIFHFSLYTVPESVVSALEGWGRSVEDYGLIVLHQANKTMMARIYDRIGAPAESRFYCLEKLGNSSGASTPSALAIALREGRARPGDRVLLCSFGGGLAWGAASIRFPAYASPAVENDPVVPVAPR